MSELEIPENYGFEDIEAQTDVYSLVDEARLDYSIELPPPITALKINGAIYGSLGDFSLVYGKAKSRKTFAITLALAGALGGSGIFEGTLPPDKKRVVFCDTEQSKYHVLKVAKRVQRLTGKTGLIENFDVFSLRTYSTLDRKKIIEHIISNTPDLGLLVIDGIRDLVSSINSEEEATEFSDLLLKWTGTHQIHIVVVLHQNKGDRNARGHLGSELVNKAETSITVELEANNKEVSKVEAEYSRNKSLEPFAFMINDSGLPEIVEGWVPKTEQKAGMYKMAPDEIDEYKHRQILNTLKSNTDKPNYSTLVTQTSLAVKKHIGEQCGDNKAKQFIEYWKNENNLKQHGKPRSRGAYYEIFPYGYEDEV